MSKHLELDLEQVKRELLSLSALVEDMILKATRALREQRSDLAQAVIDSDVQVNQREVQIEEEALKIIALHQPVAIDLRRIVAVVKINNDLERIADLAVNIAERADQLILFPEFPIPDLLDRMAQRSIAMVGEAIDAFVRLDVAAAEQIRDADDEVDKMNVELIASLREVMRTQPELVEPALQCFSATRHLERIADHATNIAEDVVFLVQGEIARHKPNPTALPK
ncbi:MAG: phosphate transport system regulatory protein PhoU [Planctomycetota bacterium]|nr:MAG: phosphate transport system regulatory protein PhoU [Planctomycetota bacterium]REJ91502.1 MAG: phosphate transport system regulatory protein PhoU [Planctomycetota bacterium]REK26951.1 MAG: phosphate transport system regulatory protein PhoU [Planctomycetota bacterium]REK44371.1 MAG: phosphate transport system regulatory protein PhoU [Planctomycetota bacterium]